MAARPGTRRGCEETSVDGSPARPSNRGKSYLEEPKQDSLQRPTSRRGPHDAAAVFSRSSAPSQQRQSQLVQPQRQKGSSWQQAQQQTAASGSGRGQLQEDPSDVSVSFSDLDAMGSTLSIGADSSNLASGSASANHTAAQTGVGKPVSSSSQQTAQLQRPALQVLQLNSPKQQSPARPVGAGHTAMTVAAAAPVIEPSISYTMSESPAYSDDFLSIKGSGVEIEYSEPYIAAPTHHTQQHGQPPGPGHVSSSSSTQTAAAASTPVQLPPRQLPAATAARSHPYSIRLSADDSAISADIEFSSSSVTAGANSSPAATASPAVTAARDIAQPARLADPLPMGMPSTAAPAAAATASKLKVAPAGRRLAGANLQLADDDSVSSYGSAEIEFEPPVAAVSTGPSPVTRRLPAETVPGWQHAAAVEQNQSPAQPTTAAGLSSGSAATATDEAAAAAATDELFAMLLAVPKRHSSSSSSGSTRDESVDRSSPRTDAASPTLPAGDSPKDEASDQASSSHSSRRTHTVQGDPVHQHIAAAAAAAASDDAQQLPSAALDVLTGLQELHKTLQVVRQLSLSTSDASSTSEDSSERSADSLAEQSSSYSTHDKVRRQRTKLLQPLQADAAAAAAETSIPVSGSLQAVKHQRLSQWRMSTAADEQQGVSLPAAAAEVPANGSIQQQQQGRTIDSPSCNAVASQQAVGAEEPVRSNSQTISVDIDDLLRQQSVATAAVGSTKQARRATVTAASTAKRRSVALQVGSSNEKGTQVMFDEPRQLLWDGGSLIQQQQQQSVGHQPAALSRRLATALTPPAAGAGTVVGGAAEPWTVAAVPTSSTTGLGRLGGVSAGGCWSVLSAALQQFRAAALLDQLEGLLRTAAAAAAGQQTVTAVQGLELGQPLLLQQQVEASGSSVSAAMVAAPSEKPAAAEWFSVPTQVPRQQQQQQQKTKNEPSSSQHQAHGLIDGAKQGTEGAWMTLPSLGVGAAAAFTQQSGPAAVDTRAGADGDEHWYTAAQQQPPAAAAVSPSPAGAPAAAESSWFGLPLASTEKPSLPPIASSNNRARELHSATDRSSTSDQRAAAMAEVDHDAAWLSLPTPANTGATAAAPAATTAPAAVSDDAGWFSLPVPAAAVAAPVAAAATSVPDEDTWFSLPRPAAAVVAPQPPAAPPAAAAASDAGWLSLPMATGAPTLPAPPAAVVGLGLAPTAAPAGSRLESPPAAPATAAVASQYFSESLSEVMDSGWMALPSNTAGPIALSATAAAADTPSNVLASAGSADTVPYGIATERSSSFISSVSTIPGLSPTERCSPLGDAHHHTAANPTTAAGQEGASGVRVLSSRQNVTGPDTVSSLGVSDSLQQSKDAAAAAAAALTAHQQYTSDFESVSGSIDYTGSRVDGTAQSAAAAATLTAHQQYTSDFESISDSVDYNGRGMKDTARSADTEAGGGADSRPSSQQYTSDFEAASNLSELHGADQMIHAAAIGPITSAGAGVAAGEQAAAGVGRSGGEVLPTAATGGVDLDQYTATGAAAGPAGPEVPATPAAAAAASVSGAAAQAPAESNGSEDPPGQATTAARMGPQDQQQQQGPAGVDTMLRYLTYLDSLVTQGLAPPGLTLATAKSLRDTLLQSITATQQQQLAGLGAHGLPSSRDLRAQGAITAAAGAGGAGDLYYEDLVATCCLDSFMSSSLLQLKRKLARPVVRAAWGADTGDQMSGGLGSTHGKQVAALSAQAAAQNGGEHKEVGRGAAHAYWTVPGRQRMFSGQLELPSRSRHRYTTLEDTLKMIKQHRASVYGSRGVIGELR